MWLRDFEGFDNCQRFVSNIGKRNIILSHNRGVFSTGAMGALASAILKNRLSAPAIFGYLSNVGKNCGW